MSVQVRRRREAASFLQTYVGAQGELLVDTTNNRVQVHDGATPGGWASSTIGDLPGRNALINGTFAIDQRGYASGGSLAAGAYAHDRWKAGAGGCTYTFSQSVPDTTLTITAGTLIQAVDAPNVYATAYWLTWLGSATARVWQGSAAGTFSGGTKIGVGGVMVNALLVAGLAIGTIANVEFGTGTLGLVQFEAALPNAGPTRFERRHLSVELGLCQRYFEMSYTQGSIIGANNFHGPITFGLGSAPSSNYSPLVFVPFKSVKRTTPTITLYSPNTGATGKAYDQAANSDVAAYAFNAGDASFQFNAQAAQAETQCYLFSHYTASAEI